MSTATEVSPTGSAAERADVGLARRPRDPVTVLLGPGGRTSSIPALDGLRGVAALMVFTRHAWSVSGRPVYRISNSFSLDSLFVMSRAVDWFFVLSAFLLGSSFMLAAERGIQPPRTSRFYRTRACRIFPAYWVVLALFLTILTPWLASNDSVYSLRGLAAFVGFIPMLSTILPWSFGRWMTLGPVWTLTHEVTLYLLLPFVWRLFARRRWRVSLAASAAITVGWLYFIRTPPGVDLAGAVGSVAQTSLDGPDLGRAILVNQFPAFVFSMALGLSLAAIWARVQVNGTAVSLLARHARRFAVLGAVIVGAAMVSLGKMAIDRNFEDAFALARDTSDQATVYYYLEHVSMALGFVLLLSGVVLTGRPRPMLEWRWLRAIGVLGYGIFLLHFPVLFSQAGFAWMGRMSPAWHLPVAWVVGLATTVLLALVLWFAVERPAIEWGRRASKPRTAQAAAS